MPKQSTPKPPKPPRLPKGCKPIDGFDWLCVNADGEVRPRQLDRLGDEWIVCEHAGNPVSDAIAAGISEESVLEVYRYTTQKRTKDLSEVFGPKVAASVLAGVFLTPVAPVSNPNDPECLVSDRQSS